MIRAKLAPTHRDISTAHINASAALRKDSPDDATLPSRYSCDYDSFDMHIVSVVNAKTISPTG